MNLFRLGYAELSYTFASFIAFGYYKIRCVAEQSVGEKSLLADFFRKSKTTDHRIILVYLFECYEYCLNLLRMN